MLRVCLVGFLLLIEAFFAPAQSEVPSSEGPVPSDQWAARHIAPPELISGDRPDYPVEASFQGLDGQCLMAFVVNAQGVPDHVHPIHCTNPSFEDNSVDAVRQYRFKPATIEQGKPVPVAVRGVLQYHSVR